MKGLEHTKGARSTRRDLFAVSLLIIAGLSTLTVFMVARMLDHEARPGAVPATIRDLDRQLTGLERRIAAFESMFASVPTRVASPLASTQVSDGALLESEIVGPIEHRVVALERLISDLRRSPNAWTWEFGQPVDAETKELIAALAKQRDDFPHIAWLSRVGDACSIDMIGRLKSLASDRSASVDARHDATAALKQLGGRLDLGDLLLDDAVCQSILESARQATDTTDRSRLYASLGGASREALRAPLLEAARSDPSPLVRDTIVGNLRSFLPNSEVEQSLRWIRDNDSDPNVRDEADEVLKRAMDD